LLHDYTSGPYQALSRRYGREYGEWSQKEKKAE
jgi:hypothetical protein